MDAASRRPVTGLLIVAVGIIHLAVTPLVYGDAWRSIGRGGIVGAVDADPGQSDVRGVGFWYATAGIALLALGCLVTWIQQEIGVLPRLVAWLLLVVGLWGVVLLPLSPFWVFLIIAVVAWRAAGRQPEPRSH